MQRRSIVIALGLVALGLMPLMNSLDNPRLSGLHGADRLQLIAVGWCFGIAFGFLMVGWKAKGN